MRRDYLRAGAFAALALAAAGAAARPLVPAEQRYFPYTADIPACDDSWVLSRIQSRFSQKEGYYWNSTLEILSYDKISQYGLRTNGSDYIPRRYCSARATLSDGKTTIATYTIGEKLGMIGVGYGVDYCLSGYDRSWSYGYKCDALRPVVTGHEPPPYQAFESQQRRPGKVTVTPVPSRELSPQENNN